MAAIGIDCSGKIDSLPMYMVAAKPDDARVICVKRIPEWIRRGHRDWKFIAYSAYAFKAIKPLFRKNPRDTILVDRDFDAEGLHKVQMYLEYLINAYFCISGPQTVNIGDDHDPPVLRADFLSKQARKGRVKVSLFDPNISEEVNLLLSKL